MAERNDRSKQLFEETVNYDQTVRALIAFSALVVHDGSARRAGAEFGIGRRMTRLGDGSEVTPDLVAQSSGRFGVAAEAKRTLGKDQSHWLKTVTQVGKYRDPLRGWFTHDGLVQKHDALVLVHQSRARKLARFVDDRISAGEIDQPGISVVEFNESTEAVTYYFFRLERGAVSDATLARQLEFGTQVPLTAVLKSLPNLRYYDSQPPIPLLLSYLWTDYFPSLLAEAELDEKTKSRRIRVNLVSVTAELQRANGSAALLKDERAVEFPKVTWLQRAFDRLRKFGLAKAVEGVPATYDVYFRAFRGDVRQHFCDLEAGLKESEGPKEFQPDLFTEGDDPEPGALPMQSKSRKSNQKRSTPSRKSSKKRES